MPTPKNDPEQPPFKPRQRYASGSAATASDRGTLSGKLLAVLLVVILAAIVVALAKYVQHSQMTKISGQTANVRVIDDHNFKLTVDITRSDVSVPSYCIVTALNYDIAEVGRREIFLPAGGDSTRRIDVELQTTEPAVSGDVYGCATDIPFYLDQS